MSILWQSTVGQPPRGLVASPGASHLVKVFLVRNWFVLSLPLVAVLALFAPGLGATGGRFRPEVTGKLAVALIFILQGWTLPTAALREGAGRWRLHALIQTVTFVVFPILGIVLDRAIGATLPPDLRLGFLFLFVLPSTISMSVVLTTLAGGNTVGALFNAALSNLLGVVVTPLWMGWLMKWSGNIQPMGGVIRDVVVLLILPLVGGQLLRLRFATWADYHKKALGHTSSCLILFIVFTAFCNSVQQGTWQSLPSSWIAGTAIAVASLLVSMIGLVELLSRALKLDRADRIAASFCAPQKTVAAGIPLAKALFGAHPGLGVILLPLLLYHPLQLMVCGVLADQFARKPKPNPPNVRSAP